MRPLRCAPLTQLCTAPPRARARSFLVHEWCNSTLGQALRSSLLHSNKQPLVDLILVGGGRRPHCAV